MQGVSIRCRPFTIRDSIIPASFIPAIALLTDLTVQPNISANCSFVR
jgi:hypothetical protein